MTLYQDEVAVQAGHDRVWGPSMHGFVTPEGYGEGAASAPSVEYPKYAQNITGGPGTPRKNVVGGKL